MVVSSHRLTMLINTGSCRAQRYGVPRDHIILNKRSKKDQRKKLRSFGTSAEAILWKSLQRSQLLGKKFRRQVSIGRYIVDFYCSECRVIVELDGAAHFGFLKAEYEQERTSYLESLGLRILRFENRTVFKNRPFILHQISDELRTANKR